MFLGLNLRLWISRIHSEEVSGSLAFGTCIFSSSGFRCGPQTESVYNGLVLFVHKIGSEASIFDSGVDCVKYGFKDS